LSVARDTNHAIAYRLNTMPTKRYRTNSGMMATHNNAKIRQLVDRAFAVAAVALLLAGCSTQSSGESKLSVLFVPAGKYLNYTCQQLEIRANAVVTRRNQLKQLMAKAGDTLDGRLIGTLAYQTEYTESAGDLTELRRMAADKECKPIATLQKPS
jgi:hypothetical protein